MSIGPPVPRRITSKAAPPGCGGVSCSVARFVAFLVAIVVAQRLALVLLQLSLERSQADPQGLRGTAPVSSRHLKRREDRLALYFGHRLAHERRDRDGLFRIRHGRRHG